MIDSADQLLLTRAIELAEQGMFSVTANPRVGCVLAKNGRVIGRGYHQQAGLGHAEVNALEDARRSNRSADIAGSTAYVSLEPCCHAGRTRACTEVLTEAGIIRVVVAMLDPHPEVAGEGVNRLRAAGIQVDVADRVDAQRLNYGHVKRMRSGLPYVRIKVAQSLDGRTAMASGESQWITSEVARRDVQYWRARSGAVVTGIGTALADDPSLNVRLSELSAEIAGQQMLRQPLRVLLDSHARADRACKLLTDGHPTLWVVAGSVSDAPELSARAACEVLELPSEGPGHRLGLSELLKELAGRGCNEVLVEAGATLVGECLAQGLWDELLIYTAPKLLGSDARPTAQLALTSMSQAIEAKIASVDLVGSDVRTRLVRLDADLDRLDCSPLGVPPGFLSV